MDGTSVAVMTITHALTPGEPVRSHLARLVAAPEVWALLPLGGR